MSATSPQSLDRSVSRHRCRKLSLLHRQIRLLQLQALDVCLAPALRLCNMSIGYNVYKLLLCSAGHVLPTLTCLNAGLQTRMITRLTLTATSRSLCCAASLSSSTFWSTACRRMEKTGQELSAKLCKAPSTGRHDSDRLKQTSENITGAQRPTCPISRAFALGLPQREQHDSQP